jgi:hypothetical protein
MRGAFSEIKTQRQDNQMRPLTRISDNLPEGSTRRDQLFAVPPWGSARLRFDSFLFCLTRGVIFDNRHGLLKKFDSARAATTLSAAKP